MQIKFCKKKDNLFIMDKAMKDLKKKEDFFKKKKLNLKKALNFLKIKI